MKVKRKNKIDPNFNMSSMTDIVFLLLIFFMLTSTLVSPNALNLLLPKSESKTIEKTTTSVSIDSLSNFYIETTKVNKKDIEGELIKILSDKEDPGIILNAHKNTPIEQAVKIMDIAYRNNYKIVLATSQN
jgi:biopolymer transport protein ExbD